MDIHVEPGKNFTEEIKYVWKIWGVNRLVPVKFVEDPAIADFSVNSKSGSAFPVATAFYDSVEKGLFGQDHYFKDDYWIRNSQGAVDYLATAFYMINSLQEIGSSSRDEIGRFRYRDSYQFRFDCLTKNVVQECFDILSGAHPKTAMTSKPNSKSSIYLTHDIDSVNGAWLQDSLYLLKKGQPHKVLSLLYNAAVGKPDWLNMDKIMAIEDEYSLRSTFFWLVNRGRVNSREVNADYRIRSRAIQAQLKQLAAGGWHNALHKSISGESLREEAVKSSFEPVANRYHYLKFTIPDLYNRMEESGLQLDSSLGFAEAYGFRNNYGLPFTPYNLRERRAYRFVEVPLHLMDGTFQRYLGTPQKETPGMIIDFLEANKFNCVLTLLWHNTFFTQFKFKGYLDIYKKVLAYLVESKFDCIDAPAILKRYSLPA